MHNYIKLMPLLVIKSSLCQARKLWSHRNTCEKQPGCFIFKTCHQTWKPKDQPAVQQLFGLRVCDAAEAGRARCGETSGQTADSERWCRTTDPNHRHPTPALTRRQGEDSVIFRPDRTQEPFYWKRSVKHKPVMFTMHITLNWNLNGYEEVQETL